MRFAPNGVDEQIEIVLEHLSIDDDLALQLGASTRERRLVEPRSTAVNGGSATTFGVRNTVLCSACSTYFASIPASDARAANIVDLVPAGPLRIAFGVALAKDGSGARLNSRERLKVGGASPGSPAPPVSAGLTVAARARRAVLCSRGVLELALELLRDRRQAGGERTTVGIARPDLWRDIGPPARRGDAVREPRPTDNGGGCFVTCAISTADARSASNGKRPDSASIRRLRASKCQSARVDLVPGHLFGAQIIHGAEQPWPVEVSGVDSARRAIPKSVTIARPVCRSMRLFSALMSRWIAVLVGVAQRACDVVQLAHDVERSSRPRSRMCCAIDSPSTNPMTKNTCPAISSARQIGTMF